MELRHYQVEAKNKIVQFIKQREQRILLQSATASGKTFIFSSVIAELKSLKFLVLFPRIALITQTHETLSKFGVTPNTVHNEVSHYVDSQGRKKSLNKLDTSNNVQISTPETYLGDNISSSFKPDVIVFDEAHKMTSTTCQAIRDMYPDAIILGVTATVTRQQHKVPGDKLTDWYNKRCYVETVSMEQLIQEKSLLRPVYHNLPDKCVIDTWEEKIKGDANERTVIFCNTIERALTLASDFKARGITAETITTSCNTLIDQKTNAMHVGDTHAQREQKYQRFISGKTKILITVEALAEGWDCPAAKHCMIERSIRSKGLYVQVVGRVMRPFENDTECCVYDFAGTVDYFGKVEHIVWDLDNSLEYDFSYITTSVIAPDKLKNPKAARCANDDCRRTFPITIETQSCPHCDTHSGIHVQWNRSYTLEREKELADLIKKIDDLETEMQMVWNEHRLDEIEKSMQKLIEDITVKQYEFEQYAAL